MDDRIDILTWTSYLVYMTIIHAHEAPRFELPGLVFTGLASPSRGSADLCTWRLDIEPGFTSPDAHTIDRDEVFVVVSGAIRLAPDGAPIDAGGAAVVHAGTPIQVSNAGDGPAAVMVAIGAGFSATMDDGTVIGTPPWAV
jgi:mannose-6-phosphate isomerase-like protein (cupin superfamily)